MLCRPCFLISHPCFCFESGNVKLLTFYFAWFISCALDIFHWIFFVYSFFHHKARSSIVIEECPCYLSSSESSTSNPEEEPSSREGAPCCISSFVGSQSRRKFTFKSGCTIKHALFSSLRMATVLEWKTWRHNLKSECVSKMGTIADKKCWQVPRLVCDIMSSILWYGTLSLSSYLAVLVRIENLIPTACIKYVVLTKSYRGTKP